MTYTAGQVVEAELSGGTPDCWVRGRLDREPWPDARNPAMTVVSDGASVTAVVTDSIRPVEDDGATVFRRIR